MSAFADNDEPASPPSSGSVRRHHTISAHSRSARATAKEIISEETEQALWNDDEPVDQDWVGSVGAVGEKTSLHRQSSLPTRYHRGFQNQSSRSGNITPKTVNSLAAIAGHEGDEEPWNMASYQQEDNSPTDDPSSVDNQSNSSMSPHRSALNAPSPPPAASGGNVRRHVSLTAAVRGPRKMEGGLKRSGTLQAPMPAHASQPTTPPDLEHAEEEEYGYDAEDPSYDDEYYLHQQQQQQQPHSQGYGSSVGRSSPWSQGGSGEWRSLTFNQNAGGTTAIDDVSRALSQIGLADNNNNNLVPQAGYGTYNSQAGQSMHPPRFQPIHPPPPQAPGSRSGNGNNTNANGGKLQLVTEFDGRKTPLSQPSRGGYMQHQERSSEDRSQSASGMWEQKDRNLSGRTSNPNMQYTYQKGGNGNGDNVPSVPPIPQQYLQQGRGGMYNAGGNGSGNGNTNSVGQAPYAAVSGTNATPIDVPSLIAAKGYNPVNFDIRPNFARYFVIKSYTEDDVHKSLKYEIWSSTDPGNKRLDKAFKEMAGRGPIYLFFSVNASGHFCGMAEMISPVDYSRSSTVWASDKWKGVFNVRWIFVRDIPNLNLRQIKLNNTAERKPVTNSRDTQELPPEAGQEMLRIFHTHPARTSLLQDFAFYELQSIQKMQSQGGPSSPSQQSSASNSAVHSPQLPSAVGVSPVNTGAFIGNPNAMAYQMPQMMPMGMGVGGMGGMGMGMGNMGMGGIGSLGMGMGIGGMGVVSQGGQAMHHSVMRHPSPSPQGQRSEFMGMQNY